MDLLTEWSIISMPIIEAPPLEFSAKLALFVNFPNGSLGGGPQSTVHGPQTSHLEQAALSLAGTLFVNFQVLPTGTPLKIERWILGIGIRSYPLLKSLSRYNDSSVDRGPWTVDPLPLAVKVSFPIFEANCSPKCYRREIFKNAMVPLKF